MHRQSATYKSINSLRHGLGANRRDKVHLELNGVYGIGRVMRYTELKEDTTDIIIRRREKIIIFFLKKKELIITLL